MARDMRPELLGTKAQKIRFWIDDVDIKVKRRLEERIKFVPTSVTRLSLGRLDLANKNRLFVSNRDDKIFSGASTSRRALFDEEIVTIDKQQLAQKAKLEKEIYQLQKRKFSTMHNLLIDSLGCSSKRLKSSREISIVDIEGQVELELMQR